MSKIATDFDARRLTVDGAAAYLGMSVSYLNQARLTGRGPVYLKIGRKVFYDRSDLDAFLGDCRQRSTSDQRAVA